MLFCDRAVVWKLLINSPFSPWWIISTVNSSKTCQSLTYRETLEFENRKCNQFMSYVFVSVVEWPDYLLLDMDNPGLFCCSFTKTLFTTRSNVLAYTSLYKKTCMMQCNVMYVFNKSFSALRCDRWRVLHHSGKCQHARSWVLPSKKTTPDVPINLALRMSVSIPGEVLHFNASSHRNDRPNIKISK